MAIKTTNIVQTHPPLMALASFLATLSVIKQRKKKKKKDSRQHKLMLHTRQPHKNMSYNAFSLSAVNQITPNSQPRSFTSRNEPIPSLQALFKPNTFYLYSTPGYNEITYKKGIISFHLDHSTSSYSGQTQLSKKNWKNVNSTSSNQLIAPKQRAIQLHLKLL